MRVFVTGGSGFIGQRLVRALIQRGDRVVCLARSDTSRETLAALGADVSPGDLCDADALARSVRDANPTHVAHLAAEIATQRSAALIDKVNVRGTRALIQACRAIDGLQAFLFLSTVVRGLSDGRVLTEDEAIAATTPYGLSKQAGDEMVLDAHRAWGLPGVVLRPSHVYGAGGWFAGLVEDRLFRLPGKGDNLWDMVHVDDVVSACLALLDQPRVGEAFHVVDDEPLTMKQFFDNVAQALGRKPYGHVPVWLARLIKGTGAITAAVRSGRSSNAKLKQLGWAPNYPRSSSAIADVVAELRASN